MRPKRTTSSGCILIRKPAKNKQSIVRQRSPQTLVMSSIFLTGTSARTSVSVTTFMQFYMPVIMLPWTKGLLGAVSEMGEDWSMPTRRISFQEENPSSGTGEARECPSHCCNETHRSLVFSVRVRKKEQSNISTKEWKFLQEIASDLLSLDDRKLEVDLSEGEIVEVLNDEEDKEKSNS